MSHSSVLYCTYGEHIQATHLSFPQSSQLGTLPVFEHSQHSMEQNTGHTLRKWSQNTLALWVSGLALSYFEWIAHSSGDNRRGKDADKTTLNHKQLGDGWSTTSRHSGAKRRKVLLTCLFSVLPLLGKNFGVSELTKEKGREMERELSDRENKESESASSPPLYLEDSWDMLLSEVHALQIFHHQVITEAVLLLGELHTQKILMSQCCAANNSKSGKRKI